MKKVLRSLVPSRDKHKRKTAETLPVVGSTTPKLEDDAADSQLDSSTRESDAPKEAENREFSALSIQERTTMPIYSPDPPAPKPLRLQFSLPNLHLYGYDKLPTDTSLRVLELLPGRFEDPVSCTLHFTSWDDPMPFEAISYAWGDRTITTDIICDGKKFAVTTNLADCLWQLRYTNESRYLWADAICINQEDLLELGHQVDNMRRIYSCAQKLLIWLGKDEGGYAHPVQRAMLDLSEKCLAAYSAKLQDQAEANEDDETHSFEIVDAEDSKDTHVTRSLGIADLFEIDNLWPVVAYPPYHVGMPLEGWQAIEKLFLTSWFSRLWVFQEVVTSRMADVYWGDTVVSWDVVGLTATYIQSWSHVIDHKFLHGGAYNCYTMRNRNNHDAFSVPSILDWSRTFRCSIKLDRIYGLLGFPAFRRNGFKIQADYSRTPAELFIEVVNQCILTDRNLQILSYVDHTLKSYLNRPSWVPQWDPANGGWTIGYKRTSWTWCASKSKEMQVTIDFDKSTLNAKGILIDVIKSHKSISNAQWFPYRSTKEHPIPKLWKEHAGDDWTYPSGERAIDVLGAILVAGIPSNECNCCTRQDIIRKDFAAYVLRSVEDAGEDTSDGVWQELHHKGAKGDFKGYEQNGMNFCFGRSYFTTEKGWMGLGPNTLEEGDLIVILYGGDIPYVIRPRAEGGYVLVGESYVHGTMLGELMPTVDSGETQEQIWEIW